MRFLESPLHRWRCSNLSLKNLLIWLALYLLPYLLQKFLVRNVWVTFNLFFTSKLFSRNTIYLGKKEPIQVCRGSQRAWKWNLRSNLPRSCCNFEFRLPWDLMTTPCMPLPTSFNLHFHWYIASLNFSSIQAFIHFIFDILKNSTRNDVWLNKCLSISASYFLFSCLQ